MSNHYKGNRYVPKISKIPWSSTIEWESLIVVQHQGNSYTSCQHVPTGIDITNVDYWICTGNYNAQVEQYRTDSMNAVNQANSKLSDFEQLQDGKFNIMLNGYKNQINAYADGKYSDIDEQIDLVNANLTNAKNAITAEMGQAETNLENTVSGYTSTVNNQIQSVENMLISIDIVYDSGTSTDVLGDNITIIEGGVI